ncbi:MAG TPA: isoprenylcysteine carboxylmethyltransferase family protein [Candidatus Acidoferrum sp.]|nr:isoprenylcysteine carboxylmethyltransferase family protein [Candidatus Acidoferrum sp.]
MSDPARNLEKPSEPTRPPIRATFFARWRVRVGYLLAIVALLLAHPMPKSIAIGGVVGLIGLWVRGLAAGHLHKQETLTVSGPYAHTRNPLYFGSAILTLGAAVAMNSWIAAVLLLAYFAVFYSVVMRKEEGELRFHHGAAFEEYAKAVPLFFPRVTAAKLGLGVARTFSFAQYKKNREYRATIGFLLLLVLLVIEWRLRLGH